MSAWCLKQKKIKGKELHHSTSSKPTTVEDFVHDLHHKTSTNIQKPCTHLLKEKNGVFKNAPFSPMSNNLN